MRARYVGDAEGVVVAFGVAFTHDGSVEVPAEFADKVKGNRFFVIEEDAPAPASEPFVPVDPDPMEGFQPPLQQTTNDAPSLSIIEPNEGLEPLTHPAEPEVEEAEEPEEAVEYVAKHRGRGNYSIMKGDEEVREGLTKADATAFNEMTAEDKAAYVASEA